MTIKFCTVAPKILRQFLDFLKNCAPLLGRLVIAYSVEVRYGWPVMNKELLADDDDDDDDDNRNDKSNNKQNNKSDSILLGSDIVQ